MKIPKIAACLAFLVSSAAFGADLFTVNVPVEIKSLNAAITGVQIYCQLTAREPATGAVGPFGPRKFTPTSPVTAGNYMGPSPVVMVFQTEDFAAAEQASLANVTGGSCRFSLYAGSSGYAPIGGETNPVLAQRPGTPFRSQVIFTFP
jgi:hypothetical protein